MKQPRMPYIDSMDMLIYAGSASLLMISLGILIFLMRGTP